MANRKLYETIGETKYDGLVVDTFPKTDVFMVTIKSGEGKLLRGSVLAMNGADGKMEFLAVESNGTLDANCILAEDADATSGEVTALAYRTGHFATNKLLTKSDYALTFKDKEALRKGGILLSVAM